MCVGRSGGYARIGAGLALIPNPLALKIETFCFLNPPLSHFCKEGSNFQNWTQLSVSLAGLIVVTLAKSDIAIAIRACIGAKFL